MSERPIRVAVIDDSAFARKVVREVLSGTPEIEVVGIARDGLDALEKIAALAPDVVTLDLVMPNLDGVGVLRALASLPHPPAVIVVSTADDDSELGVAALAAGAFDVVKKPTALATERLYTLGEELRTKVLAAAKSRRTSPDAVLPPVKIPARNTTMRTSMLVVGTSTGGPQALTLLFRSLPAEMPIPICVVLHMPMGYTEAFANRLDSECALEIIEARDGLAMIPGRVVVARAGVHLRLGKQDADGHFTAELGIKPVESLHRPSADVLFTSAAEKLGAKVLGVVMTGMGNDGTAGARAIRGAGGRVLTEAESSCVVYGMPRSVVDADLSTASAPLEDLAALILQHL